MKPFFALGLIFVFVSCSQISNKNQTYETNDSTKIMEKQDVAYALDVSELNEGMKNVKNHQKLITQVDTSFHNFFFTYRLFESEVVVERKVVNWMGETETVHYPEMYFEIHLSVDDMKILSGKKIDKMNFENFVSQDEISELLLYFVGISELSKEGVVLELNLCVPDTSDCYFFYFTITTNGEFQISERQIEWDF